MASSMMLLSESGICSPKATCLPSSESFLHVLRKAFVRIVKQMNDVYHTVLFYNVDKLAACVAGVLLSKMVQLIL